ncbi:MAG: hypothetical protein KDF60_07715 [Calditrichaeota bacterium]|nr:hypothetical protein [Calditrichota bacterium]
MRQILFLIFTVTALQAQSTFFYEKKISGTPLMPSEEYVQEYFKKLQNENPSAFKKLTHIENRTYTVGEERDFNVLNLTNPDNPKFDKKTFVLKVENTLINIWVEKAELANNHVTSAVINDILNGLVNNTPFGSYNPNLGIYEIHQDIFGSPPDVDGNGKVDFLLTDIKDGWDGDGSYVGGFFFQTDQTTNPGSNRADIMYVDTYPGIYYENNDQPSYHTSSVLGTVSHELQHLIQYKNDPREEDWVNEGLSELASFLCGYGLRSPDLFLKNADLSLTGWDNDNSLPHYARVALWTYFLYEKYGIALIKEIARNASSGANGVNSSLSILGAGENLNDVVDNFYKTLTSNELTVNSEFAFNRSDLQHIRTVPQYRISKYNFEVEIPVNPFSMQSVEFINGDSLVISFNQAFDNQIYINRNGPSGKTFLDEYQGVIFNDLDFGETYHTLTMNFINNSPQSQVIRFTPAASQKYDLISLEYGSDSPDFFLQSLSGYINAIQFVSPRDNAFIKSVEFYNSSTIGDIRFHLYKSNLSEGSNPQSITFTEQNIATSEWTRVDFENIKMEIDRNQLFNVGIEYLDDGAIGYEVPAGSVHKNRSFRKIPNTSQYLYLSDFYIGTAENTLDGIWMIRMEIAAPFTGTYQDNTGKISNVKFQSLPFIASSENFLTMTYDYDGSNDISMHIYNSLGQLIMEKSNNAALKSFSWDGKNMAGEKVATGMYIISIGPENKKIFQRIILMR